MSGAVGIDVVSVSRWQRSLARTPALAATAFTAAERRDAAGDEARLAVAWAVKEAIGKALGSGFAGLGWRGVELRERDARRLRVRVASPHPAHRRFPESLRGVVHLADDHAVVAVGPAGHAGRCAARVVAAACGGPPAARHRATSRSARRAAEAAARDLRPDLGAGPAMFHWHRHPDGAPLLAVANRAPLSVSLAHERGLVAAIVAAGPSPAPPASHPTTFELDIALDLELDLGLRVKEPAA